jgi:O-antigen/teichoic acid export membrane protein
VNKLNVSKKYSLKEQVGYLFSGKIFAFSIQIIIPVVLVRLIDKADYGMYLQFLLIGQFLSRILTFALPASLYYFYPIANKKVDQLISQTYFLLIFIALLSVPILLIFGSNISIFFDAKSYVSLTYPLTFYVFLRTICLLFEHVLIVEQKSNFVIRYLVIFTALRVSSLVFAFLIYQSVFSMIWALVLLHLLTAVFLFFYLMRNYNLNLNVYSWNRDYIGAQIKYSYPLALGDVVHNFAKRADKFILSLYFSANDFAIYSVANLKIPIVNMLFPSVSNVIVPQITKRQKEGDYMQVKYLWHKMISSLANISVPFVIFFIIIAKPLIIFLYTDQYADAVNIYRILLLTIFTLTLRGTTILMAYGKTQFIFIVQIISMTFNLVLAYILILKYGLYGAAVSVVLVAFIREFILIYKSKVILGLTFGNWLPWSSLSRTFVASLLPLPLLYPIMKLTIPSFFILALATGLYFIVVVLIYHWFKIINLVEVRQIVIKKFKSND